MPFRLPSVFIRHMSSRSSTSKRRTGISKEGKADMALAAGDDTNRTVGGALANSPAPPKKLKIFHYFGGKGEGACVRPLELRRGAPLAREASRADEATVKNGTGHVHVDSGRALGIGMTGQERREAEAGDAPAEGMWRRSPDFKGNGRFELSCFSSVWYQPSELPVLRRGRAPMQRS